VSRGKFKSNEPKNIKLIMANEPNCTKSMKEEDWWK
jgi:hypothetical protein